MPKVNFNVPFVNELGQPVTQIKVDNKKLKFNSNGQPVPEFVIDEEGNAVQDTIMIKDMIVKILLQGFEGDDKLSFSERAKRGKLARKVQTSSSANYAAAQLTSIEELAAKSASTILIAQLDDLINGSDDIDAVEEKTASEEKDAA